MTGSAGGIGRATAQALVVRGYRVVVSDVDGEAARRTAAEIGAVAGLEHDVRDPAAHHVVAEAAREHGPLRVWVNNAGVGFDGALADLEEDRARALVEINLMGVVWGMRAALAAMDDRADGAGGADRAGGDVVNIASLSGLGPFPGLSLYAATKAAVVSLTTSVAAETPRRIRVHALCPDGVATDLVEAMEPGGRARALVSSGGRLLRPDEVAERVPGAAAHRSGGAHRPKLAGGRDAVQCTDSGGVDAPGAADPTPGRPR